jgi:hypothetical protein
MDLQPDRQSGSILCACNSIYSASEPRKLPVTRSIGNIEKSSMYQPSFTIILADFR